MGATRRASRRMQRRGLQAARKEARRAHDRALAELIAKQTAELQQVADDWDPFEPQTGTLPSG